jgi:Protein of unknown function (DUF4232)
MNRNPSRASAAFALALVLGGCTGTAISAGSHAPAASGRSSPSSSQVTSPAPARTTSAVYAGRKAVPACRTAALALRYGPELSPMTGEHGAFYALVNQGQSACTLHGYPGIALYDAAGTMLPFRYVHRTSMYVTKKAPRTVLLPPGASAYVLVAKYRCDLGVSHNAATIRLTMPGRLHTAMAITVPPGPYGAFVLSYCKGGPDDPGQVIGISPIEPAPADAGPFTNQ